MPRETGSKVVEGKVVPPSELPDLGSPIQEVKDRFRDGRINVSIVNDIAVVEVQPGDVVSICQGRNKLNNWVTLKEISTRGGKFPLKPPPKQDASQEFTAVRLLEVTCGVNYAGGSNDGVK